MSHTNPRYAQNQHKPEAVLEQAIALDGVDKAADALTLMKPIYIQRNGKPVQRVWSQPLEDLTLKYVELAVKSKSPIYDLRSILQSFRGSCVSVSANAASTNHPQSVLRVVRYLLVLADKSMNFQHLTVIADDQDSDETPESLVSLAFQVDNQAKGALQEQQQKNRSTSALRLFLDYYRVALDTTRVNPRTQMLHLPPPTFYTAFRAFYEETAKHCFELCQKYSLTNEFSRFSQRLRPQSDQKDRSSYAPPTLAELENSRASSQAQLVSTLPLEAEAASEVYQILLATKLQQLNTAIALEYWVETNSTFLEINDILSTVQDPQLLTSPNALLIQYRFVDFLWTGKNTLLHAFALLALYNRLTAVQQLNPENPKALDELFEQIRATATQLKFPANSWIFAPIQTVFNGIILSVILSQPVFQGNGSPQPTFGGLTTSSADLPMSALNSHNFYVSSAAPQTLNTLFAPAFGTSAQYVADKTQVREIQVDKSFATNPHATIAAGTTGIADSVELYKYSLLLDTPEDPSIFYLIQFINRAQINVQDNTMLQFFHTLSNRSLTPLRLYKLISKPLDIIFSDIFLQQYTQQLYTTVVTTVLFSLSAIYSVLNFDKFVSLLPPSPFVDPVNVEHNAIYQRLQLEHIITQASSAQNNSIRIDHSTNTLILRPYPHQVEQRVHTVLGSVTSAMHTIIAPALQTKEAKEEKEEIRAGIFELIRSNIDTDIQLVRTRHAALLDKRKEIEQASLVEKEKVVEEQKAIAEQKQKEQERKLEQIRAQRELEEKQREENAAKEAKKLQIAQTMQRSVEDAQSKEFKLSKAMMKQVTKLTETGSSTSGKELTEVELREFAQQIEVQKIREQIRQKRERKKLVDFAVRALRFTQREKLLAVQQAEKSRLEEEKQRHVESELSKHKAAWEKQIVEKRRFAHMMDARDVYRQKVIADRQAELQVQREAWAQEQAVIQEQERLLAEQKRQADEEKLREQTAKEQAAREAKEAKDRQAAAQRAEPSQDEPWRERRDDRPANKFSSSSSGAANKFTKGSIDVSQYKAMELGSGPSTASTDPGSKFRSSAVPSTDPGAKFRSK